MQSLTPPPEPTRFRDARDLRAYAHPTRMALVGLLRTEGKLTATQAAQFIDESVASISYHLRVLRKYHLVEEAGGGKGREKPWRATADATDLPKFDKGHPAHVDSMKALTSAAQIYFSRMLTAIDQLSTLSADWQEASEFGDELVYITAENLSTLSSEMSKLILQYSQSPNSLDESQLDVKRVNILRVSMVHQSHGPEKVF